MSQKGVFDTRYLRLTRAHTVFAGINAVWRCAVHRQAPACHLRRASPYSISAAQKLHRTFRRGKIRMARKRTPAYWRMPRTMTQSALICTAEKRVYPCQAKVRFDEKTVYQPAAKNPAPSMRRLSVKKGKRTLPTKAECLIQPYHTFCSCSLSCSSRMFSA